MGEMENGRDLVTGWWVAGGMGGCRISPCMCYLLGKNRVIWPEADRSCVPNRTQIKTDESLISGLRKPAVTGKEGRRGEAGWTDVPTPKSCCGDTLGSHHIVKTGPAPDGSQGTSRGKAWRLFQKAAVTH